MKAILAIDIDGTVMDFVFPLLTRPKEGFRDFAIWASKYFHLHFFSTRFNPEVHGWTEAKKEIRKIRGWFQIWNIPYDHITPYKPPAILFIDDRAFGFDVEKFPRKINWKMIKGEIGLIFEEYIREIDDG